MIANVNTKKIIEVVVSTHFLLVLALFAILKASGFTLITLFGSSPPPTHLQSLVFDLFGLLLYPMCILEMPKSVPENWFTIGLWVFVFNSIIWGVCLGIVIHAVRQKFRKAPTDLSRPGGVALTGLLVLFSIFAVGCCASLERMAHREIEKRPLSKVYLGGMKYFQDLMKQGQVPGVKSAQSGLSLHGGVVKLDARWPQSVENKIRGLRLDVRSRSASREGRRSFAFAGGNPATNPKSKE